VARFVVDVEEGPLVKSWSLKWWSGFVEREVVVEFAGELMGVEATEENVGEREGEDAGEDNTPEPCRLLVLSVFSMEPGLFVMGFRGSCVLE
jgi:hypothetical protein